MGESERDRERHRERGGARLKLLTLIKLRRGGGGACNPQQVPFTRLTVHISGTLSIGKGPKVDNPLINTTSATGLALSNNTSSITDITLNHQKQWLVPKITLIFGDKHVFDISPTMSITSHI